MIISSALQKKSPLLSFYFLSINEKRNYIWELSKGRDHFRAALSQVGCMWGGQSMSLSVLSFILQIVTSVACTRQPSRFSALPENPRTSSARLSCLTYTWQLFIVIVCSFPLPLPLKKWARKYSYRAFKKGGQRVPRFQAFGWQPAWLPVHMIKFRRECPQDYFRSEGDGSQGGWRVLEEC